MRISLKILLPLLILAPMFLSLGGCGCGFSCNGGGGNNDNPASLTLGFSDALPEDLKQVVIRVESITFERTGAENVVIEEFTIPELSLENVTDFQVNLLDYRGLKQLPVIEDLELSTGTYSAVSIQVLSSSLDNSYVVEDDSGLQKVLNVPGDTLRLENLQLSSGSQTVTVEFSLAQALQFQSNPDTYQLTTTGIRMENNETAASLTGRVDDTLFNSVSPCSEKADPLKGNRVYLYEGSNLSIDRLVDVFTSATTDSPPEDAVAPFAVASLEFIAFTQNWEYSFGYIPAGEYTMAFSCNTEADDSVEWNALTIPLPDVQVYNISLLDNDKVECNISESANCASAL